MEGLTPSRAAVVVGASRKAISLSHHAFEDVVWCVQHGLLVQFEGGGFDLTVKGREFLDGLEVYLAMDRLRGWELHVFSHAAKLFRGHGASQLVASTSFVPDSSLITDFKLGLAADWANAIIKDYNDVG